MNRKLPAIRLDAKPAGLKFKAPASAVAKWDRTIKAAAKKDEECAIDVMGDIGESFWGGECTTAVSVKAQLKSAGKAPVLVTINSPGGDAFEGIAIYNLLREHPGAVNVNVIGMAASAASIIAMAGDKITVAAGAMLMIHSAWGMVVGNRHDMQEMADMLDKIDNSVAELYASRSKQPVADVLAMMEKETWMTGPEAVAKGFADVAVADKKPKAAATKSISARAPVVLLGASAGVAGTAIRMSANNPGATGNLSRNTSMKTIQEQIASFEAKRQASAARMTDIMAKAADEGRTLDEAETQEYDTLAGEVKAVDGHIVRLKAHEVTMVARAAPVIADDVADPEKASAVRANSGIISVGHKLEKGIPFARMAIALHRAHGDRSEALNIVQANRRWMDQTPEIAKVLMTAVPAADTLTAGWASELVYAENLQNEFIEFLRPMTILGRLTGVRRVPFNVRIGSLTGGTTGFWTGQGKAIPMSKGTTGSVSLGMTKAAGLSAYTDEILKSSSPSIETMVRDDLGKAVSQVVDIAFIDPNNGGIANEKPASILYGITPTTPSGTNAAAISVDVAATFAAAIAANLDPTTGVWVMTPTTAQKLGSMKNALGQKENPDLGIKGGVWEGLPVIVSQNAYVAGSPQFGQMIVLIIQDEIILADDGGIDIQISNEASIEMLDNPTNLSTGATAPTTVVSMFQTSSWAIKAVRAVNWTKRRSAAAAFIQAAAYQ